MAELLIGCGNARQKVLSIAGREAWTDLVTMDMMPDCGADVVHDLEVFPYPFADDQFEEIHAKCVLEHIGRQGDWRFWFAQWTEFARIMKDGAYFFGEVPCADSPWAWGDPSHTRIITLDQFVFLSQQAYRDGVGKTSMSDFRSVYKADFTLVHHERTESQQQRFILQVHKE